MKMSGKDIPNLAAASRNDDAKWLNRFHFEGIPLSAGQLTEAQLRLAATQR